MAVSGQLLCQALLEILRPCRRCASLDITARSSTCVRLRGSGRGNRPNSEPKNGKKKVVSDSEEHAESNIHISDGSSEIPQSRPSRLSSYCSVTPPTIFYSLHFLYNTCFLGVSTGVIMTSLCGEESFIHRTLLISLFLFCLLPLLVNQGVGAWRELDHERSEPKILTA